MVVSTSVDISLRSLRISLGNYANVNIPYRVLEVNVGLTCACLLTLPAFLEKQQEDWNLYMHRFTSYLWGSSGSNGASQSNFTPNGGGATSAAAVGDKSHSGTGGRWYKEIDDTVSLPNQPRGDIKSHPNNYHSATIKGNKINRGDIEELPLKNGVSVTMTVDVQEDFPPHEFGREGIPMHEYGGGDRVVVKGSGDGL